MHLAAPVLATGGETIGAYIPAHGFEGTGEQPTPERTLPKALAIQLGLLSRGFLFLGRRLMAGR